MNEVATTVSADQLKRLAAVVKTHLEETHETQGQFAARAGVQRGMLSLLINDSYESSPQFDNVCKIARAAGYEFDLRPAGD